MEAISHIGPLRLDMWLVQFLNFGLNSHMGLLTTVWDSSGLDRSIHTHTHPHIHTMQLPFDLAGSLAGIFPTDIPV